MTRVLTDDEIAATVCRLAAEQSAVNPAEVTLDTHLFTDLNFDSLAAVEYAMLIEDEFDLSIPDEESSKVQTVRHAYDLVQRALKGSGTT